MTLFCTCLMMAFAAGFCAMAAIATYGKYRLFNAALTALNLAQLVWYVVRYTRSH